MSLTKEPSKFLEKVAKYSKDWPRHDELAQMYRNPHWKLYCKTKCWRVLGLTYTRFFSRIFSKIDFYGDFAIHHTSCYCSYYHFSPKFQSNMKEAMVMNYYDLQVSQSPPGATFAYTDQPGQGSNQTTYGGHSVFKEIHVRT